MPDVMFTGPEGRLEGRYHQSKEEHAPIALILHPQPRDLGKTRLCSSGLVPLSGLVKYQESPHILLLRPASGGQ